MKPFTVQILDDASALGRRASSAHPAGALAHLGTPHPDRKGSHDLPSRRSRSRRPSTTAAQPAPSAPTPVPTPGAGAARSAESASGQSASSPRVMVAGRWSADVAATAAIFMVAMPFCAPSASAREALPAVSAPAAAFEFAFSYAAPLSQLGGRTFAQYVADHEAHACDWSGSSPNERKQPGPRQARAGDGSEPRPGSK